MMKYLVIVMHKCWMVICFTIFITFNPAFCSDQNINLKPEITIPFEIHSNFIILNLKVNGVGNMKFIYDSGSEHSLFFELAMAQFLNFRMIRSIQIFGSDMSKPIEAYVGQGVEFETEKKQRLLSDIIILNENIFKLNEYFGIEISGIVGNSMFRNKVMEIDYDKLVLKIYAIENFDPVKSKFKEIPSRWIKGKPYIYPNVKTTTLANEHSTLLFDTGASIGLLLYTNFMKKDAMPDKMIPGTMGMGLGGPIEGYIGRVDGIEMSEFKFDNIITHFQKIDSSLLTNDESAKHGIIGNSLISHFNVALDFSNHRLYLKNNKSSKKKMNVDRSGLLIVANGVKLNEFTVREVMVNSAGAEADIRSGDILIKINNLSSQFYSLGDINNRLASNKKNKVKLILNRDGKKVKKVLYLKDVI